MFTTVTRQTGYSANECEWEVSILTHTYPHKPLKKIKWRSAITRLTAHFVCGVMSDLVIWKIKKRVYKVIHHSVCPNCPYWHQVLSNNTKPKLKPFSYGLVSDLMRFLVSNERRYRAESPTCAISCGISHNELTLKVLNFWKFTSYCNLKPLWSGMGEVVSARTSPTLHLPSPPTVHRLSWLAL